MPKRLKTISVLLIVLSLAILAACGGEEEPAATPTPLAAFTPTAAATVAPSATATAAATATPETTATAEATATPEAAATSEVTATAEITATEAVTATDAVTETAATPAEPATITPAANAAELTPAATPDATTGATAGGDGFTSPLLAPDSPLAPPALVVEEAPATPLRPVTGSWQLRTIMPSSGAAVADAPEGYRVAFGRTGVVRVMGDCKTGRGTYSSGADGALAIDITYSDVRCAPESLADPFARALNDVTGYRFNGDQLVLAYGAQGGEMGLARTAQMAAFGAPFLKWQNLQNSTYLVPGVPAGDNQAILVDGEFRAQATPQPPAGEFVVSLATMHTYGVLVTPSPEEIAANPEITAEVTTDTVAVLVVEDGAADAAPRSYLAPVLNGGGLPLPLPIELLGENVFVRDLRWDGTTLTVDFDQDGATARRTYTFDGDHFTLEDEEQLPAPAAKARLDLPAQPVTLSGAGEATMSGVIAAGEIQPYRLALAAGQQLSVTIQSPYDNVWLSIFGRDDQTVLRSIRSDTVRWTGNVPSTQEYLISAVAPGSSSPYTLTVQVTGAGDGGPAPVPEPTPAPATAGAKAVHLVIDGATAASAPVLNALQSNNATVDFFAGAAEAATVGSTLAAAGSQHGAGIIASPIKALTSDGRDALFAEVNAARQAAGSQPVRCLRLPAAAANDAYTRAAAAEQGYDVLQWDIYAAGMAPDEVIGQVFPNAVIRLGGEGGSDVAATLEALLPALAQQGFSVQSLCRE